MTHPYVSRRPCVLHVPSATVPLSELGETLFGLGNLPSAFESFANQHRCNAYCKVFGLGRPTPYRSTLVELGEEVGDTPLVGKSQRGASEAPVASDSGFRLSGSLSTLSVEQDDGGQVGNGEGVRAVSPEF